MWKSIRGRSLHTDLISLFKKVELPSSFLKSPNSIPGVLSQVEIYASAAQAFNDTHGRAAQSPWAELGVDALPMYEISALIDCLDEIKISAEAILSLAHQNTDLVSEKISELRNIISAAQRLPHVPNDQSIAQVLPLNLDALERALTLKKEINNLLNALRGKPDLTAVPLETMSRAIAVAQIAKKNDFIKLTPAQLFDWLERRIVELENFIAAIEGLVPALKVINFDKALQVKSLAGIAIAIIVASKLRPEHRMWLGRFKEIDIRVFEI